jgi:DNA-binding MarR family transcriptional regulator
MATEIERMADEVLMASRALLGVAVRSLGVALEELTLAQYRVLVLLSGRGPLRSGFLADELGIHASTFSRMADRLVAGGWVRRLENPESRREVLVELTEVGQALVQHVTARRTREVSEILRRVDPAQREVVLAGFTAFAEAAGTVDAAELSRLGVES